MERSIYTQRVQTDQFDFIDNHFHAVQSKEVSRLVVSVLENGRLGIASGTLLSDPEALTADARRLCAFSRTVDYSLPTSGSSIHGPQNIDIPALSSQEIIEFCQGIIHAIRGRYAELTVDVFAKRTSSEVSYQNGHGVRHEGQERSLTYVVVVQRSREDDIFTEYRAFDHKVHLPAHSSELPAFIDALESHFPIVEFRNGDYPALLLAETLEPFLTGFWQGLDGKRLYEKQSPLVGKLGARLFDERFSLAIDPLAQGTGNFDVEGVASRRLPLVERGVLCGALYDLEYAQKCGEQPSGLATGNMRQRFQTEPILVPFGLQPLDALLASAGRGVLIQGCHEVARTTNLKGDFSCGLDALYFDGGRVQGRIKNLNMAANLFELFGEGLAELSSQGQDSPTLGVMAPHLLFRSVSFTA